MSDNSTFPHRHSLRLKGYDYSQAGAYFVTICAHCRKCLFGEVVGSEMNVNEFGLAVQAVWEDLPVHYPHVMTDAFVVMPNHVHGVFVLGAEDLAVGAGFKPARTDPSRPADAEGSKSVRTMLRRHGLSEIVRGLKSFSARRINVMRGTSGAAVWQRNYYEHVIRGDADYNRIAEYVANNPLRWKEDTLHPEFTRT
jgi:putative transposase